MKKRLGGSSNDVLGEGSLRKKSFHTGAKLLQFECSQIYINCYISGSVISKVIQVFKRPSKVKSFSF